MKLSKKQEAELMKVYNTWWDSYLNGDVKTYDSFLEDDFRFVGSTDSEEFLNRKDATAFFEDTAEQLAGKAKRVNSILTIEPMEGMVLITDLADAYVKSDSEWVYYARFRFTSMMRNTKNGWRFFYQHFSTPDLKAQEGETIGTEKISAENLELKSAIKRRTAELELKNRDLEIEASLERIRAKTTAMKQSSDLLDIVVTMRTEFVNLGHEAHYFWHMRWLPDRFQKAMTSGDGSRIGMVMELPRDFHSHYEGMTEWEENEEPVMVLALETEIAVDYVDKMIRQGDFQQVDPNAPTLDDIRHIKGITFVMARTSHGEIGYSLPGVVKNPPKEDLDILVRFAGAFDLAHRRFLDLQKAENQAREVEIELALEKVRSRSIGMRKSEELREVIQVIHDQLIDLNFEIDAAGFTLDYHQNNDWNTWIANKSGSLPSLMYFPYIDHPQFNYYKNAKEKGLDFLANTLSFEDKNSIFEYMFKFMGDFPQAEKDELLSKPGLAISQAFLKNISLWIYNLDAIPYSDKDNNTLMRFAKVFEQAYIRFNDLKKAEAQAREAQIEAALERVRARTMAMQQSEELAEVATVLFQQVKELGIPQWTCGFNIWKIGDKEFTFYPGGPEGEILPSCQVPLFDHPIFAQFDESRRRGDELLVYEKKGELGADHYRYMHSLPGIGDMLQGMLDMGLEFPEYQIDHIANFAYGNLIFITYEPFPEMHNVFVRFAKVFEQTYTRFLDLKKAEAQAREAKIEGALERVRSRTVGMQQSQELGDVATVLFKELNELVDNLWTCGFVLCEKDRKEDEWWLSTEQGFIPAFYLPNVGDDTHHNIYNGWKKGKSYHTEQLEGEALQEHYDWLMTFPVAKKIFDEMEADGLEKPTWQKLHCAYFSYGYLVMITRVPCPEEEIFKRFAKVFDQTYRRFLDLQKAEAQAREAEIELALERVRARTMAMQKSEELKEVIQVVYEQFVGLNIHIEHTGFILDYKANDDMHIWLADRHEIQSEITFPYFDCDYWNSFNEAKEKGLDFFITHLTFEEKNKFYEDLFKLISDVPEESIKSYLSYAGLAASTVLMDNVGLYIENFSGIPYSDEENAILMRFGKVFQQTYTRFQDLQKAEKQSREAQINLAVERVRASALAMHNSSEIMEVVTVLRDEMLGLEIPGVVAATIFLEEEDGYLSMRDLTSIEKMENGFHKALDVRFKLDEEDHRLFIRKIWTGSDHYFLVRQNAKDIPITLNWLKKYEPGYAAEVARFFETNTWEFVVHPVVQLNNGKMTVDILDREPPEEMESILTKMGAAFDLAYKRFEDLQKAEAQARESQIETSLERVRSRSMAMHNSDELREVVATIFEQLQVLKFESSACNIIVFDKESGDSLYWVAGFSQDIYPLSYHVPFVKHAYYKSQFTDWKKGKPYSVFTYQGTTKKEFDKIWFSKTGFKNVPAKPKRIMKSLDKVTLSTAYIKYGALQALGPSALSEENANILKRFGNAFEQTYTRFLDLQKAEEQARESQIEVALEKIRSRTMAMQKGEELKDVVVLLYKELMGLGVTNFVTCGYVEVNEEIERQITWVTGPGGDSLGLFYLPLTGDATFDERYAAWQRQQAVFHQKVGGEVRRKHLEYAITTFNSKEAEEMVLTQFPDPTVFYCFNFSHGYLHLVTGSELTKEEEILIARFTKVFEQTYARFLDLQKAETQAREAQIEAALERTRNRSMQMQHSDEIKDLSKIFHEQLHVLNIPTEFSYVWLPEEDKQEHMFWATWSETTKGSTSTLSKSVVYPLDKTEPYTAACYKAWASEEPVHESKILPEETKNFFDTWKELLKGAKKLKVRYFPEGIYYAEAYMKYGCFGINIRRALQKDEADILHRFAIEFERAYTRFLDLQKAEAQTRESQIEAALERVRSKTMAMHNSSDVKETVKTFFDEVLKLGIDKSIRCGIGILEGHEGMETWSANATDEGEVEMRVGMLNMTIHPMLRGLKKAWKNGEKGYSYNYTEKDVFKYYKALNNEPEYPFNADLNNLPKREYHKSFFFSSGIIFAFSENPMTEESSAVLQRFAEVFGQTYRRFLDLRKAEAQSREAQIELALERVRNRAMAMRKSNELGELIITVFKELQGLDMELTRCLLWIFNKEDESASAWMTNSEDPDHAANYDVPYHDHPAYKNYLKGWKAQLPEWEYQLKGKNKDRWDEILVEGFFKSLPRKVKNAMKAPQCVILSGSFNKYGLIQTAGLEPLSQENKGILKRFSQVFEQNYNRFLDLKKAEKQAREAQIEAALEKVRSRTMAMQSSTELVEAANLLFNQVRELGINAWSAGYNVLSDDKTQSKCWMSSEDQLQDPFPLYYTEEASFIEMGKFLKSKADFFVQELAGKDLIQHYDYMKSLPELQETFKNLQEAGLSLPTYQINHLCKFSRGYLLFITYEKVPEAHDIFKRFARVFEQTYTRFMDLQKAEKQSKEAQIELALERVRASTMAMHKSEQLAETAEVLFEQFDLLGVTPDRISVAIFNEKKRIFELWATDQKGSNVDYVHDFSIDEPTCMAKTYKAWKEKKESFVVDLRGKELKDWIRFVKEDAKMELDSSKFRGRRVQHCAFFSQGYLLLSSHLPIADEMMQILLRFAKVFQQTYTRFLDLQRAEEQAREAVKHASVDRVRAEIASMRTTTDLKRITPLVWNELTTLDVPFIRCGVFIMDEELQQVQTHLSTPDGKAIASFNLPFDDTRPLDQLLPYWRKKKMYTDYWDEAAFLESTKILMQRGAIASSETYVTENQPTSLHLHFFPFLQGMLYVGSEVSLTEDELNLAQNLAEAFSSAYARYEDFNKLELANKKIEKTLEDLKQTQTQLIQSEKMASLGELTAGIAHEIQNPLNFVNNFSEVSRELMKEMQEEIERGDFPEALDIGNDIEQNLEKINHHGKRASDIVKGMLQHSRSNSGEREPTDLNALTDEYLRLAYHGLRAKDKSFNVKMDTEFEDDLEKVSVVPQDMGRVILNLITNAFYVVNEKKNSGIENYEPTVYIGTKKNKNTVEIVVKDNGNGIPKNVLDKIFQPFFTTKPTGKGTGLGLSLSYDIVKAHGGEIKVETTKNKGTEFIITLPVN